MAFWRSKVLLAKIETTYATDPVPTGAANAILAIDVKISPMEGQDVPRELDLPYFGGQRSIPADLYQKIAFKVEMQASGALGTVPGWGVLLRACGAAQVISAGVSVTYNPISTAQESVTLYLAVDGTRYVMRGARGNAKFTMDAQGIPYIEFEFMGLWQAATAVANPVATLTGFINPLVVSATNTPTFTVGGVALVTKSFMMDLGNEVERRFLINSDSIIITDRAEKIEARVEAVALATLNPVALAAAQSTVAIVLTHGTAAGSRVTLNVPVAQMMRLSGLESSQNIVEWPLMLAPLPTAGNDQWTLVLT
jgi:hypothetical protein